jgi:hypothetical protein
LFWQGEFGQGTDTFKYSSSFLHLGTIGAPTFHGSHVPGSVTLPQLSSFFRIV